MSRVVPPPGQDPRRDLDEEFRFHFDAEVERLMGEGLSAEDASARALTAFGNVSAATAACLVSDERRLRRERRARALDVLGQDVAHAVRGMARRPGLTSAVVLTLALGIGVNAAVFGVVDRLFLRLPTGVTAPAELRRVYVERRRPATTPSPVAAPPTYQTFFSLPELRILDSVADAGGFPSTIWTSANARIDVDGHGERTLRVGWSAPDFFEVLGTRPVIGRGFASELEMSNEETLALLSWHVWQKSFGGDPGVIGRIIRVDSQLVRVSGILPRHFIGIDVDAIDVWLPMVRGRPVRGSTRWDREWGLNAFRLLVRMSKEQTDQQLAARLDAGLREADAAFRIALPRVSRARGASHAVPGSIIAALGPRHLTQEETIAAVLTAVALLVLIIAAANVANLLVGRAVAARRTLAIRIALGMGRGRLASQVLVESALLGVAAAIVATIVGGWIATSLRATILPDVQWGVGAIDVRLGLLAGIVGLLSGLVAGLASLVTTLRSDLTRDLRTGAREGGGNRSRVRAILVGVQAALAVVLLAGTGLLARSLQNVRSIDLGFDVEHVVVVDAPDSVRGDQLRALAQRARSLPGVRSVALAAEAPLRSRIGAAGIFTRAGDSVTVFGHYPGYVAAEPEYLSTVGTPLLSGRDFVRDDRAGAPAVMIVSAEFARRVWPGRSPLGECLRVGVATSPCATVVGVAAEAKGFRVIEEVLPVFYLPLDQDPSRESREPVRAGAMVISTVGDPSLVAAQLRDVLRDSVSSRSNRRVWTMSEMLADDYRPWKTGARLFAGFAALALSLAAIGLYGVLAHAVASRRHEIGVRVALGASRSRVVSLVAREGALQVGVGAIVGIAIALAASGWLSKLLYGVSPADPIALGGAVVALALAAVASSLIPARRAANVDPMVVLREE